MQSIPFVLDGAAQSVCISMLDTPYRGDALSSPVATVGGSGASQLYTATMQLTFEGYGISMFHACWASSRDEATKRVSVRIASHLLAEVEVHRGIVLDHPVVRRLVPSGLARRLAEDGDCCPRWRPLQQGGDLHIQERAGA